MEDSVDLADFLRPPEFPDLLFAFQRTLSHNSPTHKPDTQRDAFNRAEHACNCKTVIDWTNLNSVHLSNGSLFALCPLNDAAEMSREMAPPWAAPEVGGNAENKVIIVGIGAGVLVGLFFTLLLLILGFHLIRRFKQRGHNHQEPSTVLQCLPAPASTQPSSSATETFNTDNLPRHPPKCYV